MTETRAQTLARHNAEMQIAIEQHEIRMRTMRERHLSELALCIDQAGRTDTPRQRVLQAVMGAMEARREAFYLEVINKIFPGIPLLSLVGRVTRNVYPDREELVIDGKVAGTFRVMDGTLTYHGMADTPRKKQGV